MIRAIRVWSCSLLWVLVVFVTHTTSEAIATWEQKDPFSAPTPRAFHTMAWSSAAGGLYVFGGVDGSSDLNDLHLYVHEANQWQKINASGDAPSPRYRHTMAWSSAAGGLYVFGGLDSSYGYLNDLYLYVHEANQWQKINASGDAPSPRYRHTMAWSSAAGGLYVFGGSDSSYNYLNDLYLYVHEANQWQKINATGDAPSPRKGHAMAWSSTVGGLYVFGGLDSSYDYQNDLYLYVHEANQWQKINASGDVPSPLYGHTMAWSSAAGGLYVFGRLDSGGYLKDPNDLHLYVHEENEWRRPTFCNCAKPSAAYGHAMAWSSAAGGLYVFGGLGSGEYLSELHLYVHEDPQGWQRKVPFSTPSPRDQPTMAWSSAAGGLYMLGGINSRVQLNEPNDLYLYVPEANQWQKINATGDAPSPCYGHTMGWSSDAGLYVFGGRQLFVDGSGDHNDLHLYVHEANHWQKINATGDVPSPRYGHTMAWSSAAGGLYVFGGLSGGYLNDLYLYVHEANQWQKINALGDVPTPRFRHTMVWSGAEAGGLYLFGGWNLREDYLNDLYLYIHEANQWHEIHAGGDIPSPREGHTMAWSSAAGGLYVFGGSGRGYRYLNDLYLYVVEATQWHHIPNNWQAPSPRSGHTMAWSSAAGGLYVFGGSDDIGGGAAYNDLFFLPEVNVTVAVAPVDVGQKDIIVAAVAISSGSAFFLLLTFCAFYKRQLRLKEAASKLKKDLELNNPLAIKNFFLYSDACLVRFECLKEIYQKGQAWPRRQEADGMTVGGATALVTRKELEDVMYDEDSRKFYLPSEDDESSKLTEVHFCSVSHSWEAMEHPDPWRDQLRETINRLDHLRGHVWIFYDYASLYQFPRKTNKQMQSFNRALSHMHLLYAHDWVNVEIISKLTDQAVKEKMERDNSYIEVYNVKIGAVGPVPIAELTFNDVPYLERGWCIAEMQWASTREGEDHAVPEPPEQFAKRLCQLKFTHRSDASAVQELQEKVFREKTGRTTKLRFDKLPPEQVHILCSALQHYPKLEMITISRTKLQPTGVAAVLRCRAVLAVLVNCDLRDEEAAAMQDILENETTAVKQLEVGRNDNMSLNASKSLTLAALKKNVKLLLETEAQDRELGRKIGKSIESIQDLITVRIDGQSADEARDILASTLSQEVPDRSQRQQCEKAGTTP